MSGHLHSSQLLIDAGANVNTCDIEMLTPLILAATNGNVKCLKLLIAAGANVNIKTFTLTRL